MQVIDESYSSRPNLSEILVTDPEEEWYKDVSSFVERGEKKVGYATVSLEETRDRGSPPSVTSAQKAKLFTLTR